MCGDADRELADLSCEFHEIDRVTKFGRHERGIIRDVAPEGHHVLDARVDVVLQDVTHLGSSVTNTYQVRHRGEVSTPLNLRHQVKGALA